MESRKMFLTKEKRMKQVETSISINVATYLFTYLRSFNAFKNKEWLFSIFDPYETT